MTHLQFDLPKEQSSIIKVFGVGGGGSNAVNHMFEQGIVGVNFAICNTDAQALETSRVPNKIQLGPELTQGLGAGSNPACGAEATEESIEIIKELLGKNTKMVFVTAGMGGGTGTGGAPVVARIAKEMGILTVGIVTTPFSFEGKRKYNQALEGIEKLKEHVDTILVISNDKIREMYGNARQSDAFNNANNILATAAKSISEIITVPGYINVDFADVKYVMMNSGAAIMGYAIAEGEGRAMKAVQGALNSPLLNDNDIRGAKKILVNISSGSEQVTIDEITEINEYIQEVAKDTDIIFGTCDDVNLGAKLSVTLIATGFEATAKPAFMTPVNKIVRDLNEEKVIVAPTVAKVEVAVVAEVVTPIQEVIVNQLEDVVEEVKAVEPTPIFNELKLEEEESYSLFSMMNETDTPENVVVFEFESKVTEEPVAEVELQEEVILPTPIVEEVREVFVEEVKEEETFEVFSVKSYETQESEIISRSSLDNQLQDRKRILSQMSYRGGNKSSMNELENTPAYLRKGVEVNQTLHSEASNLSRYTISEDSINQRPEVRKNNSFLHDNVD